MDISNFIITVSHMRDAQKNYFRHRTKTDLQNSIAWEMQVDKELKTIKLLLINKSVKDWQKELDQKFGGSASTSL